MSLGEPLREVKAIRRAEPGAEDHALSKSSLRKIILHWRTLVSKQKKLKAAGEPSAIGERLGTDH
jgi:hypothetical protein